MRRFKIETDFSEDAGVILQKNDNEEENGNKTRKDLTTELVLKVNGIDGCVP